MALTKDEKGGKDDQSGTGLESKNSVKFTPDLSLKSENDDLFGHSDFVDVLEYIIENSITPLNIALYGKWGVGKSTILNFLEERIENKKNLNKKYQFVSIDAWKLSPKSIRQELLLELNNIFKAFEPEEIEDKLWNIREEEISPKTGLGKWLKKIVPYIVIFAGIAGLGLLLDRQYPDIHLLSASMLASVVIPLFVLVFQTLFSLQKNFRRNSKRIIPHMESSQQFEQLFNTIVEKKKTPKLIIAIDNLDRCEDEVVVRILGTIKTFMNVENCIYIIACDENAIIKHLKARGGQFYEEREAIEFLTKFFHVTLNIPPQIEGDLEGYADKQMKEFASEIEFEPSVKDVLISGITKNPRKIRQLLYNIVAMYKLAQIKEKKGIIQSKTVTGNTAFLTKVVMLRNEWPEFYRRLETKEDLLDLMQQYLDGLVLEAEGKNLAKVLENNPGLEYFLKATSIVVTTNIQPFLRLNQEKFESVIPELESFILKVSRGEVDYVKSTLVKLSDDERTNYILSIIKQTDIYIRNERFPFAFNSMKVLLEIYAVIPDNLKTEVLSKFQSYMRTPEIREFISRYDVDKLFPLVMEMSSQSREILLKEYCRILSSKGVLDKKLLEYFMNNASSMSDEVIESFNNNLLQLGQIKPEEMEKALEILSNNENAKTILVEEPLINGLIQRVENITMPESKKRIELYIKMKDVATQENKLRFVERMLNEISKNKTNAQNHESQSAYSYLDRLTVNDFSQEASDRIYNGTKNLTNQFADEGQKLQVIRVLFRALPNMSESNKKEFMQQLSGLIAALSPGFLLQVCDIAKADKLDILSYEGVLDNIMSKMSQTPPNENVVSFLITSSTEKQKKKVSNFILSCIKSGDPTRFQSVASAFGKTHSSFSAEICDEICKECLNIGRAVAWNQTSQLFEAISDSLKDCSEDTKNEFTDIMLTWIKSNDQNQRSRGLTIFSKGYPHISNEKQTFVIKQLLLMLETLLSQNDGSVNQVLGFLTTNVEGFKDGEVDKLIDIVTGVFATGSPQMQMLALNNVYKMNLGKRSDDVMRSILSLAKVTSDAGVRDNCKEILKRLKEHATDEFVKEAESFFGESL
jgi:GTP-binding protein EngB required for normal cell division